MTKPLVLICLFLSFLHNPTHGQIPLPEEIKGWDLLDPPQIPEEYEDLVKSIAGCFNDRTNGMAILTLLSMGAIKIGSPPKGEEDTGGEYDARAECVCINIAVLPWPPGSPPTNLNNDYAELLFKSVLLHEADHSRRNYHIYVTPPWGGIPSGIGTAAEAKIKELHSKYADATTPKNELRAILAQLMGLDQTVGLIEGHLGFPGRMTKEELKSLIKHLLDYAKKHYALLCDHIKKLRKCLNELTLPAGSSPGVTADFNTYKALIKASIDEYEVCKVNYMAGINEFILILEEEHCP